MTEDQNRSSTSPSVSIPAPDGMAGRPVTPLDQPVEPVVDQMALPGLDMPAPAAGEATSSTATSAEPAASDLDLTVPGDPQPAPDFPEPGPPPSPTPEPQPQPPPGPAPHPEPPAPVPSPDPVPPPDPLPTPEPAPRTPPQPGDPGPHTPEPGRPVPDVPVPIPSPVPDEPLPDPTPEPSTPEPPPSPAPPGSAAPAPAPPVPPAGRPGTPGARPGAPGARPGAPGARPGGRPTPPGGRRAARPGKPGGHPMPVPPASTSPTPVVEPVVEPVDPHRWGRIDADGVVYVRSRAGERAIGNWQAGDAEAGLAHFGRRFDDFATEIALLEARLASGAGDPKSTRNQAVALRESVDSLAAIGDLDGAAARLDAVVTASQSAIEQAAADRAAARARAVQAKETLCAEAEQLATSTQWKATGDRLKAIVDEWRSIRGVDRKTDDALWKRFARARDTFTRARGSHFAELDKQRVVSKEAKEKLIKRAEELSGSRDWTETTAAYRGLMSEWKAAGRAPRDVEDQLWERFRAAQEKFFSRRNQTFAERDAEFEANAAVKEKLLAEAEQIDPGADLGAAKEKLRSIQDRWEAAGKVPRERIRELDGRLRTVEERVRAASDAQWRRTDPEATARVEQFRARADQYRAQAARARAAGDDRKAAEAEEQAATWEQWLQAARNAVES